MCREYRQAVWGTYACGGGDVWRFASRAGRVSAELSVKEYDWVMQKALVREPVVMQ